MVFSYLLCKNFQKHFFEKYVPRKLLIYKQIVWNFSAAFFYVVVFGYSFLFSVSDNEQGDNTTKFITRAPSIRFDAYIWDSITFITDFAYNEQESNGQTNVFRTWNASLRYRKDRDAKWEYSLRASNILDIDSNVSNGASDISVFSQETFIQPRFITFRMTYTL